MKNEISNRVIELAAATKIWRDYVVEKNNLNKPVLVNVFGAEKNKQYACELKLKNFWDDARNELDEIENEKLIYHAEKRTSPTDEYIPDWYEVQK